MTSPYGELPPDLLQAAADGAGRIALIVGAGCSLEDPTNLKLASAYAAEVHDGLIADNVLTPGECSDPTDLSLLASVVFAKKGKQEAVVGRLPRGKLRDAQANEGYLLAAALLLEGSVAAVLSLNFDLAMSDALGALSAGDSVSVIAQPEAVGGLGTRVVIYLHRNANEADAEKWVLRAETISAGWKDGWEQVMAHRVLTSPVVVFAGLGSPAAVLTESLTWIRSSLSDTHSAYLVDPSQGTQFKEALQIGDDAHLQMGWCAFMRCLADRLAHEQLRALAAAASALCMANGWSDETANIEELCQAIAGRGLLGLGHQRASWLLHEGKYLPDGELARDLIAYLLLGLGLAQRRCEVSLNVRRDNVVEMRRGSHVVGSCLPVSAGGTKHWAAMEPGIRRALGRFSEHELPSAVLLGSLQGVLPDQVTPPSDIAFGEETDDVIAPSREPAYVVVDSLRADASLADCMVAR